ncbi:5'-nucleotidase [Oxobacter pfennigii]|uniref:5'-nucleotidase n=1 Tax=Oxobacter pfennigii TaxID=36849 RepID=A0A0N8NTY5_9CLOT|nr:HAD family hydrolase [Oxobacter pfennigii]KPU46128.1 5'-nucleotidase [Oxobacter pfennigii]
MKADGIIFDLDGTLWDATEGVMHSWNETIEKYKEVKNKLTLDDIKDIMGLTVKDVAAKLFPYIKEELRVKIAMQCCKDECIFLGKYTTFLYEKVEETLKELVKTRKLFIVSNCQGGYIETFFKLHKMEKYFTDYENSERTGLSKGENIKLIMARNNLAHPIYVGDTAGDLKAARLANIPFVYASYGFGKVKEYDYIIKSIDELINVGAVSNDKT